jgi:hypothetical protein
MTLRAYDSIPFRRRLSPHPVPSVPIRAKDRSLSWPVPWYSDFAATYAPELDVLPYGFRPLDPNAPWLDDDIEYGGDDDLDDDFGEEDDFGGGWDDDDDDLDEPLDDDLFGSADYDDLDDDLDEDMYGVEAASTALVPRKKPFADRTTRFAVMKKKIKDAVTRAKAAETALAVQQQEPRVVEIQRFTGTEIAITVGATLVAFGLGWVAHSVVKG